MFLFLTKHRIRETRGQNFLESLEMLAVTISGILIVPLRSIDQTVISV